MSMLDGSLDLVLSVRVVFEHKSTLRIDLGFMCKFWSGDKFVNKEFIYEKIRRPEKGMMGQVRAKLGVEELSTELRVFQEAKTNPKTLDTSPCNPGGCREGSQAIALKWLDSSISVSLSFLPPLSSTISTHLSPSPPPNALF